MTGAVDGGGGRDVGSAALLTVWAALLVVAATAAAATYAGAVVARHRAGRAADLAALAAARAAVLGVALPCEAAVRVGQAQQARVEWCAVLADGSVRVVVAVDGPHVGGLLGVPGTGPARARARAGVPP